ncbi:hypothetical protein [Microscilla marina]|uniref:hypothetical protein n=1 Tax=Microscilla marina TaxID=1027 RepID=UPI00031E3435|nr:hypothetical protein [Microscilla marina]
MYSLLLTINWSFVLANVSVASILLPAILAIILFKKQTLPLKILSILLWVGVLVEIVARTLAIYKLPNLPALHVYVVIEFALLAWMYQLYLHKTYARYVIPVIIIAFTIFSIINSLFIQSIYTFNTYSRPISNLLLIIFALSYFYKMLRELKVRYLEKAPMFWVNTGILIYFSGSLFLFIFSNYIVSDKGLLLLMWNIHSFLNIIHNIFYTIGLWLSRENSE